MTRPATPAEAETLRAAGFLPTHALTWYRNDLPLQPDGDATGWSADEALALVAAERAKERRAAWVQFAAALANMSTGSLDDVPDAEVPATVVRSSALVADAMLAEFDRRFGADPAATKDPARPMVQWIVTEGNDPAVCANGEFGVAVNGAAYVYYKWPEPSPSAVNYRVIGKREFGETINRAVAAAAAKVARVEAALDEIEQARDGKQKGAAREALSVAIDVLRAALRGEP